MADIEEGPVEQRVYRELAEMALEHIYLMHKSIANMSFSAEVGECPCAACVEWARRRPFMPKGPPLG